MSEWTSLGPHTTNGGRRPSGTPALSVAIVKGRFRVGALNKAARDYLFGGPVGFVLFEESAEGAISIRPSTEEGGGWPVNKNGSVWLAVLGERIGAGGFSVELVPSTTLDDRRLTFGEVTRK
jgi:hypothetical protein